MPTLCRVDQPRGEQCAFAFLVMSRLAKLFADEVKKTLLMCLVPELEPECATNLSVRTAWAICSPLIKPSDQGLAG